MCSTQSSDKVKGAKVSIIIPVHNAEKYIEGTVASVLDQSYRDFELLLVEDNSSDGTLELLKSIEKKDERIRVIVNHGSHGAAHARNLGIGSASGRFIAYLDADDLWMKDKLSEQVRFMIGNEAVFSFTAYEFGNSKAEGTGRIVHVPQKLDYRHALPRTVIFTSTVMFDMKKITKDEIMMPAVESEDTASWWKILKRGVTGYGLDRNLTIYRTGTNSLSSDKLEAVRRIWFLYRKVEKLSLPESVWYFFGWAWRATLRRL
ncbi:MAG: glycosyltransferase family 2 protein [Lachnospiraceae bacterium]|nr:glycosyltransferase family 2 protein [Lachnospiraceae bacterium]